MGFDQKEVEELLVATGRRCCICRLPGVLLGDDHPNTQLVRRSLESLAAGTPESRPDS